MKMKKAFMLAAAVAALTACQQRPKQGSEVVMAMEQDSAGVQEFTEVFEGTLPAADGPGIDYILTLNAEIQGTDTLFSLDMIYLDADGPGKHRAFSTKGKQNKVQKTVKKKPKTAVKLTPENGEEPMYFLIVNDTTLRLVDGNLVEKVTNANYDLVRTDK